LAALSVLNSSSAGAGILDADLPSGGNPVGRIVSFEEDAPVPESVELAVFGVGLLALGRRFRRPRVAADHA
jgi:hypothetical protein